MLIIYLTSLKCVCVCVLPVAPHYPAVLCSSFGGRLLWILLSASEVLFHPLLVAAEHHHYRLF